MQMSWIRSAVAVAAFSAASGVAQAQYSAAAAVPAKDIVTVAVDAGIFKTLVAAVQAADLVATLEGPGPFTVFAPTDAAFAKLPAGTVEALLADKKKLAAILTYHVVPGRIAAGDVMRAGSARPKTVNGAVLNVRVVNGKVMVDDATVTTADVNASNGVIHIIDTVVLPK